MRLALLAIPAVRSALELELGRTIEYHVTLPSTQDRARELEASGSRRLVVVAEEQTAGRGTHGRSWRAPARTSLLASWLFRPAPAEPALFALLAGVAVARALHGLGVTGARLKMPNDGEGARKKGAGALAHATSDGEGGSLGLGIGVNVRQRRDDFPPDLRESATSLALAGHTVDRLPLLVRLTSELDRVADRSQRRAALDEWRRRATVLGQQVEVLREGRTAARGIGRDIAHDGGLIVGDERIAAGEVRLL